MEVYIADEQVEIMKNTLHIQDEIETRSTCDFVVRDLSNELNFKKGMKVRIEHEGKLLFRGFVEKSKKTPITNSQQFVHNVQCIDLHYLADKRIVALADTNVTAQEIIVELIQDYLEAEGVSKVYKYWIYYQNESWEEL